MVTHGGVEAIADAFPAGTRFTPPAGGMVFWIELPRGISSLRLFHQALERGVRIMPGTVFSNAGRFDHFIRVSCAVSDMQRMQRGIQTLGALAANLTVSA